MTFDDGGKALIPLARRDAMVLAAIWLIVTAYNLFKPYHIDDAAHLAIAHWIAANPLHPMRGILYVGDVDRPIHDLNQPVLYFYLLSIWGSLFGYAESTMHLLQSLFALAAIVLFHRIARRLVPDNALWLTAMLALGPGFVVEQNLMVDVPLLSLWLLFFDALLAGPDRGGGRRRYLIAAAACSAALLVKYSSLVLLPILILVIVFERNWRLLWIGLVPIGVVAAWSLFNYIDYGHIHIVQRPVHVTRNQFWLPLLRFAGILETLGAITPFGLILVVCRIQVLRRHAMVIYVAAALSFVLLAAAVATGQFDEAIADELLRTVFLVNALTMAFGTALVLLPRLANWRVVFAPVAMDSRFVVLLLWIAGHVAFYSLFAPFMAVRHVLLVLPAVLLAGAMAWPVRLPRIDAAFGLVASIGLSVMLGWADWRFAAFYRDEATLIPATLPPHARVWFVGGLGWLWYAAQAGLLPLNVEDPRLAPGDFLALPGNVDQEPLHGLPPMTLVRDDAHQWGIGDLFCTAGPARFYGTPFAAFPEAPWRLTRSCANSVGIYQVSPSR